MVLEVGLFLVEQKNSELKKLKNKFDHKLDTKWSYCYYSYIMLLLLLLLFELIIIIDY